MRHNVTGQAARAAILLLGSVAAAFGQARYQTTLLLQTPVTNPAGIDRVVYRWSTLKTAGPVNQADLTDLSMELYSGATGVYVDHALINGVVQPVPGAPRILSDIFWDFDLGTRLLAQMRNAESAKLSTAAGTQFVVTDGVTIPIDNEVRIERFINGVSTGGVIEHLQSQNTVQTGFPAISTLSPSSGASGAGITLTITGGGFCPQTVVNWSGTVLTPSSVSNTTLTVNVPPSLVTSPTGALGVFVENPNVIGCNAGGSNSLIFNVLAPSSGPAVSNFTPPSALAGVPLSLTIAGSNFCPQTAVQWNGNPLTVTFINSGRLTVGVPASQTASPGAATITLVNPGVAGCNPGSSAPQTYSIYPSLISGLSPSSVTAGAASLPVTISGQGFCAAATVDWAGTPLPPSSVTPGSIVVTVPATLLTTAAFQSVRVVHPAVTGCIAGTSSPGLFTVTAGTSGPVITGLNPSSAIAGAGLLAVTISGSGFCSSSTVDWAGTPLTPSSVTSGSIVVTVPPALLTATGPQSVRVVNPAVTGCFPGTSPPGTFTVTPASGPAITSLSPASVVAGGGPLEVTITGANFCSATTVDWAGNTLAPHSISPTVLLVNVPATLLATPGTRSLGVVNPAGSGCAAGTSGFSSFTVVTAASGPSISNLSPSSANAGGGALPVTILGANFCPGTTVDWGGTTLPASYGGPGNLTVVVPAGLLATAGPRSVRVINPNASGCSAGSSSPIVFTVAAVLAPPLISALSPSSVPPGGSGFDLQVSGTGFCANSQVFWNGVQLAATFVNSTLLTAAVPASFLATPATVSISVANPNVIGCGSGSSAPVTFTIGAPAGPSVSQLSPSGATAGAAGFTLTITGANFCGQSAVQWNGTALATTFGSATSLTAAVPASLIAAAGTASVQVVNPAAAGCNPGTSPAISFSVHAPPSITSLSPPSATAGAPGLTVTVSGTGFCAQSAVRWNGNLLTTTFGSSTSLTAAVSASLIATAGTASIQVVNPASPGCGAGASTAVTFAINAPAAPSISSVSPPNAGAGGPAFTLTLSGSSFCPQSVVEWNGGPLATVFVNPGSLTATVPASLIAAPGAASIRVVNPISPACGSGAPSNTISFAITATPSNLTLQTTDLVFSARSGDPAVARTVNVGSSSSALSFTARAAVTSGGNWLSVTPAQGSTPASLQVRADPQGLAAGTYTGTVSVGTPSGPAQAIPVTLAVMRPDSRVPELVAPSSINVTYAPNSGIITQEIAVEGFNGASRGFSAQAQVLTPPGREWLRVEQSSSGTPTIVTARIDTSRLPTKGSYLARIVYRQQQQAQSRNFAAGPVRGSSHDTDPGTCIRASTDSENLLVDTEKLTFAANEVQGAFGISALLGTVPFRAEFFPCDDMRGFLALNPAPGAPGAAVVTGVTNAEVRAGVSRDGLLAGKYTGTVTILDARDEGGKTIDVEMQVGEGVQVGPDSGQQEITAPSDGAAAARMTRAPERGETRLEVAATAGTAIITQSVPVSSFTGAPISVVPGVQSEGGWLRLKNPGVAVTTPGDIAFEIDTSTLTPGQTYSGAVTANWAGPQGSMTVVVKVAPAGVNPPAIEEISNAATLRTGAIAPGTLFSIKGRRFLDGLTLQGPCPAAVITLCFSSGLPLTRNLEGLQVLVDGTPVPLLFAGRIVLGGGVTYDQINALAPWSLTPGEAQVVVKRKDSSSPSRLVTVADAAPGVFTTQASGSGQGSVTIGATPTIAAAPSVVPGAQPAKRGDAIVIWATGLGRVVKPAESGYGLVPPLYKAEEQQLARTPQVFVGGRPAQIYWAGIAPQYVGLYQLIVFVPQEIVPGDRVPVQIRIGEASSQSDVTIAVQ